VFAVHGPAPPLLEGPACVPAVREIDQPHTVSRDETRVQVMKKFYEHLCTVEAFLARTFLMLMVVLIFGAGIARLVGHPINWSIDAATCIFAWACFFSADVAWRKNKLMSVEVLTNSLPEKVQRYCRLLNYFILIVFLGYLIPTGLWLSYVSRARSFQGIPEFSYSWVTMSVPLGGTLLLITTILKLRDEIKASPKGSR
jgi:TRAP-type C4-dicarboxylate transport system permease small subunit